MNAPTEMNGVKIYATIAEGWQIKFLDQDRAIMVHPNHPPRLVPIRSIKEGDILPRDTDELLSFAPQLGGS